MLPALASWPQLNVAVMNFTEPELARLLQLEQAGRNRTNFLLRIHSRFNRVRGEREKRELFTGGKNGK